jgi:hypothetical protein
MYTCGKCHNQVEMPAGSVGTQADAAGWYPLFLATGEIVWLCVDCRRHIQALITPLAEFLAPIANSEFAHWGSMRRLWTDESVA